MDFGEFPLGGNRIPWFQIAGFNLLANRALDALIRRCPVMAVGSHTIFFLA
jgi:hypothetical protein